MADHIHRAATADGGAELHVQTELACENCGATNGALLTVTPAGLCACCGADVLGWSCGNCGHKHSVEGPILLRRVAGAMGLN